MIVCSYIQAHKASPPPEEVDLSADANVLKARLQSGEPSFCFSVRMARTVNIVALASAAGYHGFYVDLQHSSISIDTAAQIFQTALHSDVTAFVRVPSLEPGLIGRVLDAGAQGILAPDIRSAEDAKRLVHAALIAPKGDRSVGGGIPNPRFRGVPAEELSVRINDATLLIAMVETPDAVEEAEAIAGVDGIDAIQIGTNDFTTAMGLPGQFTHARVQDAYKRIIAGCAAHGKPLIIGGIRKKEALEIYIRMGAARCYFTGADSIFMLEGARSFMNEAKAADESING
jgi:2-keto-3-deoxy-L-rhamnonate aldolase RhmA